jgi:hypothetical protein
MGSSVAGLTQGDYRMDGKMELITCATDGEGETVAQISDSLTFLSISLSVFLVQVFN